MTRAVWYSAFSAVLVSISIAISTPAAADDFDTCRNASGDVAIAACTRGINSGRYQGRALGELFWNRCAEWLGKKDWDRGMKDCTQAIGIVPSAVRAFNNRGSAYFGKGDYDRAIADYNQAIKLDPTNAPSYVGRGMAKKEKGDSAGAQSDFARAKELGYKF